MDMSNAYEAIVIGTGFGGAVTACRLSKKWPNGRVLVLERGKRYELGAFPRTPHDTANNFWNIEFERRARPEKVRSIRQRGLFDVRAYNNIDVVLPAGLGGGSLIYANVVMEPPEDIFTHRWPATCRKRELQPYYDVCKEVLGARPIPTSNAQPEISRTKLFQEFAKKVGHDSRLVDIAVFFGKDYAEDVANAPLPPGHQEKNRYGALQTSCTYCAECDIGCNCHAKNTLDLNYLHQAEYTYGAVIKTEHICDKIVPLNSNDGDDIGADGSKGFRVFYRDLANDKKDSLCARRVVLSAGALGSTEILLRCRDRHRTLPRVSRQLGKHMSGNGDFLGFIGGTPSHAEPNRGPVITQRIDFNLFHGHNSDRAFILEDASYPYFMSWFVEGIKPGYLRLKSLTRSARNMIGRFRGRSFGSVGYAVHDVLSSNLASRTAVLLFMGVDSSNGEMTLEHDGWLDIAWPKAENKKLYDEIVSVGQQFAREADADFFFPNPTYLWPFRKNVTVHPLGGCTLSEDTNTGVTSAARETFGQVHGYQNLYVADGAIVPTAVGANPCATIAALSEMVAESITEIHPTANL